MKKCMVLCAVFIFMSFASAEGIIREDFYLNGREEATFREKQIVLPNTLRLSLFEGESEVLYAEVRPDGELSEKVSFRLCENNGTAELYPSDGRCTVYGRAAGEDSVEISLDGEESILVRIEVLPPREVKLRSFESELPEKETPRFSEGVVTFAVRGLILGAATAFLVAAYLLINHRREDKNAR